MNQNYNGKTKEIPKPIGCLLLVGFFLSYPHVFYAIYKCVNRNV